MLHEIKTELRRVIGETGVDVSAEDDKPQSAHVRVETAQGVYNLPGDKLLKLLARMPDHAGVLALRSELECWTADD